MRLWVTDPQHMCIKHITAEHLEIHMFHSKMLAGESLTGWYDGEKFFGPQYMLNRHAQLAELLNHNTPLEYDPKDFQDKYPEVEISPEVFEARNYELLNRCEYCWRQAGLWGAV